MSTEGKSTVAVTTAPDTLIDADKKNALKIICERCPSIILQPHVALYVDHSFDLPLARQKKENPTGEIQRETVTQYWTVDDQFAFDNAGFTNSVDGTRYLTCADCELGPIGYVDKETNKIYLAVNRVKHV